MYEKFYGLKKEPFRLSPDSELRFQHRTYEKARSYLRYALHRREGIVLITGEPGVGKTTLVRDLIAELVDAPTLVASLVYSQMDSIDLLRMVAISFGVEVQVEYAENKSDLIFKFEEALNRIHSQGKKPLLIVDEAQGLSIEALEELRVLTNFQIDNQPSLQVILVGQSRLREKVLSRQMEQLHQRITGSSILGALNIDETESYIIHRLRESGWQNDPSLAADIYPLIFKASTGVPRWINQICSRLLLHGMVEKKHALTLDDVEIVLWELLQEELLPESVRINSDQLCLRVDLQL